MERVYICIDLKSFYASVECADRGLDPFTDNLVVADPSRTEKTICLAITPAMKALGVKNRCRVFEIPAGISYVMATPRMQRYLDVSAQIYAIYLRYVSPDDVHVYSVDECFIDATPYLRLYGTDARAFARTLMDAVFSETGICATAGIGTNLFLAKVALDITAKHAPDNIGMLDEASFREQIWFHQPITDIWGIGAGIARRLAAHGAHDLAGVAALPPDVLMREFGKNGEFLIDHAWGLEPCTIEDIHAYRPTGHSISNGQVLPCDYTYDDARTVMREMVEESLLELHVQGLAAGGVSLHVGYSRQAAREGHGTGFTGASRRFPAATASRSYLLERFEELFAQTTSRGGRIRRVLTALTELVPDSQPELDLDGVGRQRREHDLQAAVAQARSRFGRGAVMKGMSLKENATGIERSRQIGGHRA
jgi:DNA polymerase V